MTEMSNIQVGGFSPSVDGNKKILSFVHARWRLETCIETTRMRAMIIGCFLVGIVANIASTRSALSSKLKKVTCRAPRKLRKKHLLFAYKVSCVSRSQTFSRAPTTFSVRSSSLENGNVWLRDTQFTFLYFV